MSISDNSITDCELHCCMRNIMRIPRWFGIFAVTGLDKPSIDELRCNMKSIYYIFNIIVAMIQFLITCLCFYNFTLQLKVNDFTKVIFYLTSTLSVLKFLKLARKWPRLMKKVAKIEQSFAPMRTKKCNPLNFVAVSYTIIGLAVVEHILSVNFKLTFVMNCLDEPHINIKVLKAYMKIFVAHIFRFISLDIWTAFLYRIAILQATFIWTFMDVFIMCISMYLYDFFQDLNRTISRQIERKSVNWAVIRLHYSHLMKLVEETNTQLSFLILLRFFINIVYLCLQMFYATNHLYNHQEGCLQEDVVSTIDGIEYTTYYVFSFFFLLFRSTVTALMAVKVNTEALKPMRALRDVPSEEYCVEVQRFIRQIRYCTPALSGICFSITKEMLFGAVGAVITYEVVLLQNRRTQIFLWADRINDTYSNPSRFM